MPSAKKQGCFCISVTAHGVCLLLCRPSKTGLDYGHLAHQEPGFFEKPGFFHARPLLPHSADFLADGTGTVPATLTLPILGAGWYYVTGSLRIVCSRIIA